MSPITSVDDRAAGSAGQGFANLVDQSSLAEELNKSGNPNRKPHPFRAYCNRVIEKAGVPDAQETREMASNICGAVARLPFVPDDKTKIPDGDGGTTTEFEQQIRKTARRAEETLDSEMVWTASALKISKAALEIRKGDPDGSKHEAWVNDPLPGERRELAAAAAAASSED
jgi:hypothetical protein